jgi:heme A synthase
MQHLLRLGIVILLILLGLIGNLVVMTGLWPLRQVEGSTLPVPRFSRAPPPVLDRLLGAATITAFLLALLTGVSQLPVLAFGKSLVGTARTQIVVRN